MGVSTALKRRYVYDAEHSLLFSPEARFLLRVAAPPAMPDPGWIWVVSIVLPLEDLFRWNGYFRRPREKMTPGSTSDLPTSMASDRAMRLPRSELTLESGWSGAQPLPVKVMIVSRKDPANPAYIARLLEAGAVTDAGRVD